MTSSFPTIGEYNEVIDLRGINAFQSLTELVFKPSRLVPVRIFIHGTGSYAVVFRADSSTQKHAIKCFIGGNHENVQRNKALDAYLSKISAPWLTPLKYLEKEICVKREYYPIVQMNWIEGVLLNDFISKNVQHKLDLTRLQELIVNTSKSLEVNKIGHGDIQCGNILVNRTSDNEIELKLIDYDGMYIPAFAGLSNLERGRSEFQHPGRNQNSFNEKIDRFSFLVILTALEALKFDKTLWKEVLQGGFNTLDNLLFTGNDFISFTRSELVKRLYLLDKPSLNFYLNRLGQACSSRPEMIPEPLLFSEQPSPTFTNSSQAKVDNLGSSHKAHSIDSLIYLDSMPQGAIVLSEYKRIGITPCSIDRNIHAGKTIVLTQGTQIKTFIAGGQEKLFFGFQAENSRPKEPLKTANTTKEDLSGKSILLDNEIAPEKAIKGKSLYFGLIIVGFIIIVGLWNMKRDRNYVSTSPVDSTVNSNSAVQNNNQPTGIDSQKTIQPVEVAVASKENTNQDQRSASPDNIQTFKGGSSQFSSEILLGDSSYSDLRQRNTTNTSDRFISPKCEGVVDSVYNYVAPSSYSINLTKRGDLERDDELKVGSLNRIYMYDTEKSKIYMGPENWYWFQRIMIRGRKIEFAYTIENSDIHYLAYVRYLPTYY